MGLYDPTPTYAHSVNGVSYWSRDDSTGQLSPVEVEAVGDAPASSAPPAAEVIAALQAQVFDLKGRLGLLPGQAGKLSGARPAPPRAGAMTEARKREILAAHPSGKAVLADMDNDR